MPKVCVLGAGIIGVSTAYSIQQSVPNVDVTIIADMFMPNRGMTSYGPAGIFEPYLLGETPIHLQNKWGQLTFNHLQKLYNGSEKKDIGITRVSGYMLFNDQVDDPCWSHIVDNFCHMTREELSHFPGYEHGWNYTTYVTSTKKYIPWLMSKFLKHGGHAEERKVPSLSHLNDDFDVIVNCCGLGSKELNGDDKIYPVRGQLYKVFAPWIKRFTLGDPAYIIPGPDGIATLGGTHQVNRWDKSIDEDDSRRIWQGCLQLDPSLQHAKVIEEWAGLRPARNLLRLEKCSTSSRNVLVVHNYGHGGAGVTLHWGCAQSVVEIIKDHFQLPSNL